MPVRTSYILFHRRGQKRKGDLETIGNDEVKDFIKKCKDYLKNNFFVGYKFKMILTKPMEDGKLDIFALATNRAYDSLVYFRVNHIFAREMSNLSYNCYDDVLAYLEDGWKINNMTMDMHYDIWQELCDNITLGWEEDYPGMRLYIEYCEKYGITKEQIDKAGLEVPDIISELQQLGEQSIKEQKNEKGQKVR